MQTTITLDDTLQECVDGAIEETKRTLLEYLEENPDLDPDTDETPCLSNDLDYDGRIHEIVDSAVPIYTQEIKTAWFLHGDELEEAYENAGVGENPRDNDGMAAIYFYISEKVGEWYYENADEIFERWYEERQTLIEEESDFEINDLVRVANDEMIYKIVQIGSEHSIQKNRIRIQATQKRNNHITTPFWVEARLLTFA